MTDSIRVIRETALRDVLELAPQRIVRLLPGLSNEVVDQIFGALAVQASIDFHDSREVREFKEIDP
jgi:hypothetical protein